MRALGSVAVVALALLACASPERVAVLVPDGSASFALMDFARPPSLEPPAAGWHHRTFLRHPPMEISFVARDGRDTIRLRTRDSASMLFRWVDVDLDRYPVLAWDWLVEEPIASETDERTVAGDDHPARLYLTFASGDGDERSMEIIWGNRSPRRGDWKHLRFFGLLSFPHYTANGGDENAGRWHRERVDMTELYRELWGDPAGARLVEIALFCDTDETGASSTAFFSDVRVEKRP